MNGWHEAIPALGGLMISLKQVLVRFEWSAEIITQTLWERDDEAHVCNLNRKLNRI